MSSVNPIKNNHVFVDCQRVQQGANENPRNTIINLIWIKNQTLKKGDFLQLTDEYYKYLPEERTFEYIALGDPYEKYQELPWPLTGPVRLKPIVAVPRRNSSEKEDLYSPPGEQLKYPSSPAPQKPSEEENLCSPPDEQLKSPSSPAPQKPSETPDNKSILKQLVKMKIRPESKETNDPNDRSALKTQKEKKPS